VLPAPSPAGSRSTEKRMYQFQDADPFFQRCFGLSWVFRPWLKLTGFAAAGIIAFVLLLYGLAGLRAALKAAAGGGQ